MVTHRHTHRQTDRRTDRQIYRETDRETDRQALHIQVESQVDRQTDRRDQEKKEVYIRHLEKIHINTISKTTYIEKQRKNKQMENVIMNKKN